MHKNTFIPAILAALLVTLALPGRVHALAINAHEAGAYDVTTGEWIFEKAPDRAVPIASITKVAAALTFMNMSSDLDQLVTITREDWVKAGKTRLRIGDRVSVRTLLKLALVSSDNCAARALTHPFALSWEAYGYKMNELAWDLGCRSSSFKEPTGLDDGNVSTVKDVVILFSAALRNPVLREIMGTRKFTLDTKRGPRNIVHSSRTLRYRNEVRAAKTGYLSVAGYCMVQLVQDGDGEYITVVLGAPTKGARSRESIRLMEYTRRWREKQARIQEAGTIPAPQGTGTSKS